MRLFFCVFLNPPFVPLCDDCVSCNLFCGALPFLLFLLPCVRIFPLFCPFSILYGDSAPCFIFVVLSLFYSSTESARFLLCFFSVHLYLSSVTLLNFPSRGLSLASVSMLYLIETICLFPCCFFYWCASVLTQTLCLFPFISVRCTVLYS